MLYLCCDGQGYENLDASLMMESRLDTNLESPGEGVMKRQIQTQIDFPALDTLAKVETNNPRLPISNKNHSQIGGKSPSHICVSPAVGSLKY